MIADTTDDNAGGHKRQGDLGPPWVDVRGKIVVVRADTHNKSVRQAFKAQAAGYVLEKQTKNESVSTKTSMGCVGSSLVGLFFVDYFYFGGIIRFTSIIVLECRCILQALLFSA